MNRFTVHRNIHYWSSGSALSVLFFYLSAGSEREKYNTMR